MKSLHKIWLALVVLSLTLIILHNETLKNEFIIKECAVEVSNLSELDKDSIVLKSCIHLLDLPGIMNMP